MSEKRKLPRASSAPILNCVLPISKKKVKFRPFIVKEKNSLMLAAKSDDETVIIDTICSVINSCCEGSIDIENIPLGDMAYFFLQLRINSMGNDIKFVTKCDSCKEEIIINEDLTTVGVSDIPDTTFKLNDEVGVEMRFPTIADSRKEIDPENKVISFIKELLITVYDVDSVYPVEEFTEEEVFEWIENLGEEELDKISSFVDKFPDLYKKLEYKCPSCGHAHIRELRGLSAFFRVADM